MWHTKQKTTSTTTTTDVRNILRFENVTFEWLYLATSLTIDWSTTTTTKTTKGRHKTARPNSRTFKSGFISLFTQDFKTTMQTFDSSEHVQSIDQLFWKQQWSKTKKDSMRIARKNKHQFPTTSNVNMNLRRVEHKSTTEKQNELWQQKVKAKVVAPLQERNINNNNNSTTSEKWLWRQQQQHQHLMNSMYRRQNI